MAIANTSDYHEQNEQAVALPAATAEPLAKSPAIVVEGLLAIPNVHDEWKFDLVTIDLGIDGRPQKHCWGCVHIDLFRHSNNHVRHALYQGQTLKLNLVEG